MNHWEERRQEREQMVREQIAARGITNARVLDALRRVPRHHFIPPAPPGARYEGKPWDPLAVAYSDSPQGIGEGQTISQPYIVGLMSQALRLQGTETVLEIGAGSGYQTAVLSLLARRVVAIERHEALALRAQQVLNNLSITNVELLVGDGSQGVPAQAPYAAILAAAVAPTLPPALVGQLRPEGRIVLPIGPEDGVQFLHVYRKREDASIYLERNLGEVRFVPLVGAQGFGLPEDLGGLDI